MKRLLSVCVAVLGFLAFLVPTADARTPFVKPFMGWSSWSLESSTRAGYGTSWLNEGHIRDAADALAGQLKSAGYTNVNIDSGWNADLAWVFHTDVNGIPAPDPGRWLALAAPLRPESDAALPHTELAPGEIGCTL